MKNCPMAPTQKQIEFVEVICKTLQIDNFPMSSKEFTKWTYSQFIAAHLDAFNEIQEEFWDSLADEDYCYECCINDVWTEMF